MQSASGQIAAELVFVNGQQSGRRVPLPVARFLIGREIDCDLRLDDAQTSRHHAVLFLDGFGVRVRDLGSLNGTLLNGQRLTGTAHVRHGDRIRVGDTLLLLHAPALAEQLEGPTGVSLGDTQVARIGPSHRPLR